MAIVVQVGNDNDLTKAGRGHDEERRIPNISDV